MYNQFYPQYNQPQRQEVIKVNGDNGARAYQIAPNSSVLLLDAQMPIVYLKTSDGGGYATVTAYSITPYQPEEPVSMKALEERIEKLEEAIRNGKPNITSTRRKIDADAES